MLIVVISLFFIFKKEKYFILYIEGLDQGVLKQYSTEDLPNLKSLFSADLNSEIALNKESSFLTILSGEYKYGSFDQKDPNKYIVSKKKVDNLGLFYQTNLYQNVRENNLSFRFLERIEKILKLDKFKEDIIVYLTNLENNDLNSYQEIDGLVAQIEKKIGFNTRLLIITPNYEEENSFREINENLIDKGILTCPDNFQDLSECDLANSFAYSPAPGEVYINKKGREELGRVDWDYEGVIEDTAYVLTSEIEEKDLRMYKSRNYFQQKDVPEIFVFEKQREEKGIMLSNKKFTQDKYDYLEILNLINLIKND